MFVSDLRCLLARAITMTNLRCDLHDGGSLIRNIASGWNMYVGKKCGA